MDILSVLKQIVSTLESSKRGHFWVDEDNWYSCPLAPDGCSDDSVTPNVCNCGADKFNAEIEKTIELVRKAIIFLEGNKV